MSRVGRLPIVIPDGVKIEKKGNVVTVTGPKGTLQETLPAVIDIAIADGEVNCTRPTDKPDDRAAHGLVRALIASMVVGVTEGYTRALKIEGVGWRANMLGDKLNLSVGYSHPVVLDPPEGITFEVTGTTDIKISGISKQTVGQVAANVRKVRKPEPYKGKGIRYANERVRRKVGKAGGK